MNNKIIGFAVITLFTFGVMLMVVGMNGTKKERTSVDINRERNLEIGKKIGRTSMILYLTRSNNINDSSDITIDIMDYLKIEDSLSIIMQDKDGR